MRDWNLEDSFKPINIGIVVALVLSLASFYFIQFFTESNIATFYLWIFVAFLIISGILFPLSKRQDRRLNNTNKGYNQKPNERPFFLFGSREYNRYRIDEGVLQFMTMGYNPHRERLDKLERKQRDSNCEVCDEEVHEYFAPHTDPFYVIEDRKVYRVFGIPYKEKIVDWKSYCSEHKPENFK